MSTTDTTTAPEMLTAAQDAEDAQELLRFAEQRVAITRRAYSTKLAASTIAAMIDEAPDAIDRLVRSVLTAFQVTGEEPTQSPAAVPIVRRRALEQARIGAAEIRGRIAAEIERAEAMGQVQSTDFADRLAPLDDLVYAAINLTTLGDAEQLASTFNE